MKSFKCKGAIFDLDGVITQTAKVHFKAWKRTFDEYLQKRADIEGEDFNPFLYDEDYLPFVDGKPRYQGVKAFLESRDIELPFGEPNNKPNKETICGLGNKKNVVFRSIVEEDGVEVYQSTIDLIKLMKSRGIKVAVASSSKNCKFILKKTGLVRLFKTVIGGIVSTELGLKGKPDPDIFVTAAKGLGLKPNECLMVEDAISGVEAGRNGNFSLVIGVSRSGDKESLKACGADMAVDDMKEISLKEIEDWFKQGLREECWHLTYHGFEPDQEMLRETLTTIGNGYFGTRGCMENEKADETVHYPGTYIAGLYNKLPSIVHRKTIYNNDLVNCPNWLLIEVKIGDSDFIHLPKLEVTRYKHSLNMKEAIVSRQISFKDKKGNITTIRSERFASMDNPHYGAIRYSITPENYDDTITIRSSLDGAIINYGVARYRDLNSKHLDPISVTKQKDEIHLHVQTNNSKVYILMSSKTYIHNKSGPINVNKQILRESGYISETFSLDAKKGESYSIDKFVSIFTSKDLDISDPEEVSKKALSKVRSYDDLLKKHIKSWSNLWNKADIIINGDRFAQQVVRLHIYHLLVSASIHNEKIDAGMTARGLHGEAYRGHVFWDELFILPFYNLHFPEITKSLLMYRYRRLNAARNYAKNNGYQGAMYPWQTADDGDEETQTIHFNPVSGKWHPDLSRRQRHVSISIAYNVWSYYYCTNDLDFLHKYGGEIMIEIARFWASIALYDKNDDRYHISGVMGPDEFHEKYPDATEPGIKDNSYTNIMVSWLMHKTLEMVDYLPKDVLSDISKKINFDLSEMLDWKDIVNKMAVEINENGILSQFAGYMKLNELNWSYYKNKYKDIHRMDRILKAKGDSPDKYKLSKQADVLMIFYLLSPGQVKHILNLMGYKIEDENVFMYNNYNFYSKRTSHGSTLSHVVHSAVLKYLNKQKKDMWKWFLNAINSDIYDTQGGTTKEGVHCGVMAGTLDIIYKSFAGINIYKDHFVVNPGLPKHWNELKFKILDRNVWYSFDISNEKIIIRAKNHTQNKMKFVIGNKEYEFKDTDRLEVKYNSDSRK